MGMLLCPSLPQAGREPCCKEHHIEYPHASSPFLDHLSRARQHLRGKSLAFADLGAMTLAGSPADFGKLIADETEKWGKVIKFAGIKPQ